MSNSIFDSKYNGFQNIIELAKLCRDDSSIDKQQLADSIIEELTKLDESRKNTISRLGELSSLMLQIDNQEDDYKKTYNQMLQILDESDSKMQPGDKKLAERQCSELYGQNWTKLSKNSKQFLITAFFIKSNLKEAGLDFAPAIIEMCRAFENEIKWKIFNGYMNEQSLTQVKDDDPSILAKAICKFSEKGSIDLSLKQMLIELSKIKSKYRTYLQELLCIYIQENGWNADSLSNDPFIRDSLLYVDKFRNDAAHTTPFNEEDSENCLRHTEKRIRQFLSFKMR